MAFENEAIVLGSNKKYIVNANCKKYTLRDNGFEETKAGSFQLVRQLDALGTQQKGVRLKVAVSKDLQQLKISTTTANGLTAVNLYKMKNVEMLIEKLEFTLDGLVERDVLTLISE